MSNNYNQNGAYSDANYSQSQGYSYPSASSNAQYANPVNVNFQSYGGQYPSQQYGPTSQSQTAQPYGQQQSSSSTNLAAAALSSLSNQEYAHNGTSNSKDINSGQTHSGDWSQTSFGQSAYNSTSARAQTDLAPTYGASSTPVSTFGRLTLPEQRSTSSRPNPTQSYQAPPSNTGIQQSSQIAPVSSISTSGTYTSQGSTHQQNMQRYASPLHAVQAQQHYQGINRPASRTATSSASPQMTALSAHQTQKQWMPSESTNPAQVTVDPSQVYDFRAEQQRKARIEADRREKRAAEEALRQAERDRHDAENVAKRAEEQRREAEAQQAEVEKQRVEAERQRLAAEQQMADENARKAKEGADKKAEAAKARKARAQEKKAKASTAQIPTATVAEPAVQSTVLDEEAQMRAMFAKMREFNQRNPEMLAKLWDEERSAHVESVVESPSIVDTNPTEPISRSTPTVTAFVPKPTGKAQSQNRPAQPNTSAARKVSAQHNKSLQSPTPVPLTNTNASTPTGTGFPTQTAPTSNTVGKSNAIGSSSKQTATSAAVQNPAASSPMSNLASSEALRAAGSASAENTLWPSHKKGTLSEVAAKWLSGLPQNAHAGRAIGKHEILSMLETNPSYVQLCELIEANGIKFERSAFARELLRIIPSAPSSKDKPKTSTPKSSQAAAPRVSQAQRLDSKSVSSYDTSTSLTAAARSINNMYKSPAAATIASPSPFVGTASQEAAAAHQSLKSPGQTLGEAPSTIQPIETPRPPPTNKEEAARKRTFGDLVDLTNDESDDDAPPRKIVQLGSVSDGPKPEHLSKPISYSNFMNPVKQIPSAYVPPGQFNPPQPVHHPGVKTFNPYPRQPLAQPPLISTLPSQQVGPSNALASTLTPVPMPRKPTAKQLELERQQLHRMKGQMLVEPIMRDRVARKSKYDSRSIARDVLLATGRHPNMRPLNFHLGIMQKLLGDHGGMARVGESGARDGNRSDLSTIRWNIIDPGTPSEQALQKFNKASSRAEESDGSDDHDENTNQAANRDQQEQRLSNDVHNPPQLKHLQQLGQGGAATPAKPTPAKRGRPPKNRAASMKPSPVATPKPNSSPKTLSDMPSGTPIGYAAFAQTVVDENGNVVKRKGRPVGWRKSIHSREAQGLSPHSGQKPATTAGRALRQQSQPKSDRDSLQEPHYQVYACGWDGCRAELHNLDTLKKHVVKLHGNPSADGEFECGWANCNMAGTSVDQRGRQQNRGDQDGARFATIEQWVQHIDKTHLRPVAWKLGDGPGVSEEGNSSPASYLSDFRGRSVTPIIYPAGAEPRDHPSQGDNMRAIPRGYNSKDEREALAELRKLEEYKRIVGAVFGPEGTILANAKRRRGFLHDEDFEDIVEDEDGL